MKAIIHYALKILAPKAKAFEEATKNPMKAQEKVLFEYLRRNQNTDYGQKYDFSNIQSIKEYQKKVSLNTYNSLEPFIEKIKKGQQNVLTVDQPILFGVTSGTTGRQKFIPVTNYSRAKKAEVVNLWIYYIYRDHPDVIDGKHLSIVSPEIDGYTQSGIPFGAETGHAYKNLPRVIKKLSVLPYEVFEIKDAESKYYCILRLAMENNITTIATMNPSTIALLCHRIPNVQDEVIKDIEQGTLKQDICISDDIRGVIEKHLKPNPQRSEELANILRDKSELLPKDIWPNLKIIGCWKGGTVGVYLNEFDKYFGAVPIRDFGYIASELRGSIPINNNGADGILAINSNFYEFIPKEDKDKKNKRVLLCNELEKDHEYFIIATTPGGLYRYNIDDIIRVKDFYNDTPVIEFVQKGTNVTSISGEKLYESQVAEAVNTVVAEHDVAIKFFTACIESGKTFRYAFLVEFNEPVCCEKQKEFLCSMDKELCKLNVEYESKRKSQRLDHPVLKIVKPGEFEKYREKVIQDGAHDGQFKMLKLSPIINFHNNFIVEKEILP